MAHHKWSQETLLVAMEDVKEGIYKVKAWQVGA